MYKKVKARGQSSFHTRYDYVNLNSLIRETTNTYEMGKAG